MIVLFPTVTNIFFCPYYISIKSSTHMHSYTIWELTHKEISNKAVSTLECFHSRSPHLCFHSCSQHLCKFIGTKGIVRIRKEFNSFLGTPAWLAFYCPVAPIWLPWHHVRTLYRVYSDIHSFCTLSHTTETHKL